MVVTEEKVEEIESYSKDNPNLSVRKAAQVLNFKRNSSHVNKKKLANNFFFMQDGAKPHRTQEVFQGIHRVYRTRVIGLGYSKFSNRGLEWPPYSPDMNPCDYFLWA